MPDGWLDVLLEIAPSAGPILKRVLGSVKKGNQRDALAQQVFLALMYEDGHKVRESIDGLIKQNGEFARELQESMKVAQAGLKIARSANRQVATNNERIKSLIAVLEKR